MTARIGYDPVRIRALAWRTVESIDALARVRSDDPVAVEAVRLAHATRRNLEDLWMPLLRAIESSDALVTWTPAAPDSVRREWLATQEWLSFLPHRDLDDEALLAEVIRLDEDVPYVHDDASSRAYDRWLAAQRGLAGELAHRVATDPEFAAELAATAYGSPIVGLLTALAWFPSDFRADVLTVSLQHPWWEAGWEMDKYAGAADTLLRSLLDDPARCLEVIGRDDVARTLAGWSPLDQELVAGFVDAALYRAQRDDPALLPAGYAVLRELIQLANEAPFDGDGFEPGAATGLAMSIEAYVPTFAPALENEHAPVVARSHGLDGEYDLTLGSREELVDFFGAMVRTPGAQARLGVVLDAAIREALGPAPQVDIGSVAEFAELLALAASNEDDELAIAASARRTNLLQVGALVGLGVALGTAVAGMSTARREVVAFTTSALTGAAAGSGRADGRHARLMPIAFESIQLEACRRFVGDPAVRRSSGAGATDDETVRALVARLDQTTALMADVDADPGERRRAMLNLLDAVRAAGGGGYLDSILEENSVDDLNESTTDTDLRGR